MKPSRAALALGLLAAGCSDPPPRRPLDDAAVDGLVCTPLRPCDTGVDAASLACSVEPPVALLDRPASTSARLLRAEASIHGLHAVVELASPDGATRERHLVLVPPTGTPVTTPLSARSSSGTAGAAFTRDPSGATLFLEEAGDVVAHRIDAAGTLGAPVVVLATAAEESVLDARPTPTGTVLLLRVDGALAHVALDTNLVAGSVVSLAPAAAEGARLTSLAAPAFAALDAEARVVGAPLASPATGPFPTPWSSTAAVASFDLASLLGNAALVFESVNGSGRHLAFLRALHPDATAPYAARLVSPAFGQARAVSVAPFGGGYLVALRSEPDVGAHALELVAVSTFGDEVSRTTVAPLGPGPTRTVVRVGPDGRPYLLFEDTAPGDAGDVVTLWTSRLLCP